MSDNAGVIYLGVEVDKSGLQNQLTGLEKQSGASMTKSFTGSGIGSALGKLGTLAAGAFAVRAIVGFGASAIKLGSDLAEVQNVVDVTFGSMNGQINTWAQGAMTAYGLSETSAKKYTGTMGAMLKSMGLSVGTAASMSTAIAGLSGDFSSFYNLDSEQAFEKIRSGISGETEPLKQLGINMSVANLEQFRMATGLKTSYDKMDQASQALLRYNYLMSVSKDAQGDFARTSGSWANQTRILSLQWDSFKANFGQGLINMFSPILVGINSVMGSLVKLGAMFSAFTGALFGTQSAASGVGGALAGIANSSTGAAAGQSNVAKATKAAGAAAEKYIAPFDQLNIMQKKSGSSGSGGGVVAPAVGGAGALPALTVPAPDTSGVVLAAEAIKTAFLNAGQTIRDFYTTNLQPSVMQVSSFLSTVIVPGLTQSAQTMIDGWKGIFDVGVPLISTVLGDIWKSFTDRLPQILTLTGDTFTSLNGMFQGGVDTIFGIQESGLTLVRDLWDQHGKKMLDSVWGVALGIWDSINKLLNLWIKPAFDTVMATVRKVWDEHLSGMFRKVGEFVAKLVIAAGDIYLKFIKPIVDWLIVTLAPGVKDTFDKFMSVVDFAVGFVSDLIGGVFDILGGIVEFVAGVFTGDWQRAWTGVKDVFRGSINQMITILNGFISVALVPFNAIIKGLNKIPGVDLPLINIAIPKIPSFAEGGIVSQPTLAMIGDNRRSPEVVAPLNKLQGMVGGPSSDKMDTLIQEMRQNNRLLAKSIEMGQQINIYEDGIKTRSIDQAKRLNARAGRVVIPVGV